MPIIVIGAIAVLAIVAISTLGIGALSGGQPVGGGSAPSPFSFSPVDNTPPPDGSLGANMITSDTSTWPAGDVIWNVCCAIAIAEGANVEGSFADRNNNPGNISDGVNTYGGSVNAVDGENATVFPDKATGWQWLYNKIQNIQQGKSSAYSKSMTWLQLGAKWATPNNNNWATNVCAQLGVSINSKFSDYTG